MFSCAENEREGGRENEGGWGEERDLSFGGWEFCVTLFIFQTKNINFNRSHIPNIKERSASFYKATVLSVMGCTPIMSSNVHYLLKILSLDTITLEVRVSTYTFWGETI